MIERKLRKRLLSSKKSVLIIGPRQTGKSTLIKSINPDLTINLINESTFLNFASNAAELEQRLKSQDPKTVFIDEIQRIPSLLNTIQSILDDWPRPPKFFISGSSARKLKRGQANLLPGRIYSYNFGPLSTSELEFRMPDDVIAYGTLPGVYTEADNSEREKLLNTYVGVYLKEEIQAEALTKNLEGFARFIYVAAAEATKYLDVTKLSKQAQIERHSAIRWFEILEDTLIVHRVPAYTKSSRTRLVQHPRYFFFDNGILNALLKNYLPSIDRVGLLFENLVHSQLKAASFAADRDIEISGFRTEHGAEIDFIVKVGSETWAVECKAAMNISSVHKQPFKSFEALHGKNFTPVIAYRGPEEKVIDGVHILPWQQLVKAMGF